MTGFLPCIGDALRRREMSVFGTGDNWGREAHYRKRRVDDLLLDELTNDSFKKLSNGKYACLVCRNNPVFDSSLMLSMHGKGSRHIAAESRLKEKELLRQEEIKKRIALSDASVDNIGSTTSIQHFHLKGKKPVTSNASSGNPKQVYRKGAPLIERTLKAAAESLSSKKPETQVVVGHRDLKRKTAPLFSPQSSSIPTEILQTIQREPCLMEQTKVLVTEASAKMLADYQLEQLERRKKELKFTSAGWKRDGNRGWFRDENAEFDSDEEDPNLCFT